MFGKTVQKSMMCCRMLNSRACFMAGLSGLSAVRLRMMQG